MTDRSSRPHTSPRRTPTRIERRIIKVRILRRWGPARIAYLLGLNPSTVHRILTRYRLARLTHLDRATGRPVRRYEHPGTGRTVTVIGTYHFGTAAYYHGLREVIDKLLPDPAEGNPEQGSPEARVWPA